MNQQLEEEFSLRIREIIYRDREYVQKAEYWLNRKQKEKEQEYTAPERPDGVGILQLAEAALFDYIFYPVPLSIKTLHGVTRSDQPSLEPVEFMFDTFEAYYRNYQDGPLYKILMKHRRKYFFLKRIHDPNKSPRFYSNALRSMFLYVYEANWHLNDPELVNVFLKYYL